MWASKINTAWASETEMIGWLREGKCTGTIEPTGMANFHLSDPSNCAAIRKAGGPFWRQNYGVGISKKYPTVEEQVRNYGA
jgi:hypothetical protein